MNVPDNIRTSLREQLGKIAEELGWTSLTATEKSRYYDEWTQLQEIGGVLSRYMDSSQVRTYIKDTLIKKYVHARMGDEVRPLRVLGIPVGQETREVYTKPHGRLFCDGRIIMWGRADDWKTVLMSAFERAYFADDATLYGVVFLQAVGRYYDTDVRMMIEEVAKRLGISKIIWLEN